MMKAVGKAVEETLPALCKKEAEPSQHIVGV